MRTTIIYHQVKQGVDCPDGIVSAWVASKAFPDAKIIGAVYQEPLNIPKDTQQVIFVDFSPTQEQAKELIEKRIFMMVIDHHKTARELLVETKLWDLITGKIDDSGAHCGATLAWQYYINDSPPIFLKYIQDRDNWDFIYPETKYIHEALGILRYQCPTIESKFAFFDTLSKLSEQELIDWLVPIGKKLLAPKEEAIDKAYSRWEEYQLGEYAIAIVRLKPEEERLTSDVCMRMYQELDYPFVGCLMSDGVTFSLRSDKHGNNFDVSQVAKQYGGGGHRNAAGFKKEENDG